MALDFGMLQPVNIGGQIMAGQQEAQRNQLARQQLIAGQQQMETGALTQENLRMQIEQAKRDRIALDRLQQAFIANGKSPDIKANFNEMVQSGIPHFVEIGMKGLDSLQRQDRVAKILGGGAAMPATASTPNPTFGALGSGTFDANAAPQNALAAPTPYKPVTPRNAMATPSAPVSTVSNDIEDTYRKIDQLYAIGEDKLAKSLEERVKNKLPPTMVQEYKFAQTPEGGGFKGSFEQFKTLQAPKTTVNVPVSVSTEKKYGEKLAGNVADIDIAKMTTAEKAPQLAESANRIIDLVKQGNVFTGPAADIKLNIARALNVVGASNEEKIANTESLIAASGQSTLDAIKGAGLGTNQGFTDKDLKFLQGIAGGTIDLTAQTLTRLATLQHQAATRSAETWNKRRSEIPSDITKGMGLSTEPIKVPPLSPSAVFARNPKTGERIQSLDGGNTWKPVGGK